MFDSLQVNPAPLVAGRDVDFNDVMLSSRGHDCVPLEAMEPVYTLYTSGTTGNPKVHSI